MEGFSLAPPGYFVVDSPNETENATFSCPHIGCDGISFEDVDQSSQHEVDWHSGPYTCPECHSNFASRPALTRHFCASQHIRIWDCPHRGYELHGVGFDSQKALEQHLQSPTFHGTSSDRSFTATQGANPKEEAVHRDNITVDRPSTSLSPSPEQDYTCRELCCHRYLECFRSPLEYARHTESYPHKTAIKMGEELNQEELTAGNLNEEQRAAREFECTSEGCPFQGRKFSTAQTFQHHRSTQAHRTTSFLIAGTADEMEVSVEETPRDPMYCEAWSCPQFGRLFSNAANFARHSQSAPHFAAENQHEVISVTPKKIGQKELENPFNGLPSPVTPGSMDTFSSPESPLARKPLPFGPRTPQNGRKRPNSLVLDKVSLEVDKRFTKLEDRVAMLEERNERLIDLLSQLNLAIPRLP